MKVKVFGRLAEMVGSSELELSDYSDIKSLKRELQQMYPSIANIQFAIALNNKISTENAELREGDELALLPPFSGG